MQRTRRLATCLSALVLLTAACTSETASTGGAASVEDGVKIPSSPPAAATGSTVRVTLGDSGSASGPMFLRVSPSSVPAGDVTFVVKNAGSMVHEAVVLKTDVPFDKLPVTYGNDPPVYVGAGGNKVSEAANVGETGDPDLQAGGTRTFTIKNMVAGRYVIVCNLAGHYAMGMRAAFTVT